MNYNTKKIILIGIVVLVITGVTTAVLIRKRKKNKLLKPLDDKNTNVVTDKSKNYIIGDSQTPFIDKASEKAKTIGAKGEESLWLGGKNLAWLKNAVDKYPVSNDVNSITINIGTNGGFGQRDDISGLVNSVKSKFPNAVLYAVQGSWGWGGNKNITEEKVKQYYDKFRNIGVIVIEPAIGSVKDPHGNLPIYKKIGAELDKKIN